MLIVLYKKSSLGTSCWWNLLIELKPKKSYLQSNSLLVNVHSAVLHDSIMIIAIMEFKNNWEKYSQLCFHILCIFWHITSLQVLEIFLNCWHIDTVASHNYSHEIFLKIFKIIFHGTVPSWLHDPPVTRV